RLERDLARAVQDQLTMCIRRGQIGDDDVHSIERLGATVDVLGSQGLNLIDEVKLEDGTIGIKLDADKIADALEVTKDSISSEALTLQLPFSHRHRGVETRLIIGASQPARDDILIANVARANEWREALCKGDDLVTIAARNGITTKYLGEMLPFAFLSPKVVRAILEGRQPTALTTNWLRRHGLPASWAAQDRILAQL
ncbi:MAG: hypothetical protein ACR2O1_16750, partial [Boseongicola sp.]